MMGRKCVLSPRRRCFPRAPARGENTPFGAETLICADSGHGGTYLAPLLPRTHSTQTANVSGPVAFQFAGDMILWVNAHVAPMLPRGFGALGPAGAPGMGRLKYLSPTAIGSWGFGACRPGPALCHGEFPRRGIGGERAASAVPRPVAPHDPQHRRVLPATSPIEGTQRRRFFS